MPDWLTIEEDLHSTSAERIRRNLVGAGVECRLEGDTVQVARDGNVDQAWGYVQELLECNAMILAAADPDKVRPYKALEPDVLLVAALEAVRDATDDRDLIARLLHGFVWSQGLQNANHRSATLLVRRRLFPPGSKTVSKERRAECAEAFWASSKHLIREKEFTPNFGASLKPDHLAAACTYVDCISPATSQSQLPDV